jgi:hypothetical protein
MNRYIPKVCFDVSTAIGTKILVNKEQPNNSIFIGNYQLLDIKNLNFDNFDNFEKIIGDKAFDVFGSNLKHYYPVFIIINNLTNYDEFITINNILYKKID